MFKHLLGELCLYVNTAHFSEEHFTISLVDIAVYLLFVRMFRVFALNIIKQVNIKNLAGVFSVSV